MKKIMFLLLIIPSLVFCQNEFDGMINAINPNTQGDDIVINGIKIKGGDTLQLGFGSGFDKDFRYIIEYPSTEYYLLYSHDGTIAWNYLKHFSSNQYMIYKEVVTKRHKGKDVNTPIFYVNGQKNIKYCADIASALSSGEIVAINGKPFQKDLSLIKPGISQADELKKWKDLFDSGTITKEEYEAKKKKILEQ
jgi:Short C-terminal domain